MSPEDEILAAAVDAVKPVLKELVDDVAADLRKALSVPVGRDSRGRVTVRSKPGEYPRKETGLLQSTVQSLTWQTGRAQLHGMVSTDTYYDKYLIAMRRDYKSYIESKWGRLAEQRFAIALR